MFTLHEKEGTPFCPPHGPFPPKLVSENKRDPILSSLVAVRCFMLVLAVHVLN